jgi:hypothetical protein
MIRVLAFLFLSLPALAQTPPSLAGQWRIDPERSTELSPWRSIELTISINGDDVTVHRRFGWGRRVFDEELKLNVARAENIVPIAWWPDNRHLGAYIGDDKAKRVRAEWLDDKRILRLSSDLVLATQQGERAVNILSDYKVSANGRQLTLTEIRSTRNRPVVYVFNRQ